MLRFAPWTALALLLFPLPARAANILLVSDSGNDVNIADALMPDGHTVTVLSGNYSAGSNPDLLGDLSEYDAVFWSQDGPGYGDVVSDPVLFANLVDYVMSGGRVFVTGYDSVASPTDPMLIAFLGGTGSSDVVGPPGAIAMIDNSLTTGVVDVRGVTPTGGDGDTDHLSGLMSDTVAVAMSSAGGAMFTLRTMGSGEIAYVSNGNSVAWTTTAPGGPGAYNAVIRNFAAAADAAATEPGAPEIEFARLGAINEGDEIVVMVTVTDLEGDPFTFSWDTNDDGVFGELMGMTTYTIPAGTTDGSQAIPIAVEASDGTHMSMRARTLRVSNVDPMITSSPPTMVSVGQPLRYVVTTVDPAGDLDPPTFTIVTGPTSASFSGNTLLWTPNDGDVTMGDERVHFEIACSDGDMGMARQSWDMQVSPNRLPSNVRLLYPAGGIAILETMPRLAVEDASDPDFDDTLTYFFELDDEETFSDPVIARGEMLPEGPGFTAYQLTEPLPPGRYHWRAWAHDGFAESAERSATFFYVAGMPGDAGPPPDAPIERPDAGPPGARGGCTCTVARVEASPLLGLGLLGLLLARRRR